MRFRLAFAILALMAAPALARGPDDTLLAYGVHIHRTPLQDWGPGAGIYLGKGLFITAAHVVGRAWMTRPKVVIGGKEYPTSVVREGSFEGTDLTLLSIDESLLPFRLRMRRNTICKEPPKPGQRVLTVVPDRVVQSHILSPKQIPAGSRKFSTVIADVAETGNSGSGVFDAQQQCLLGIMSRKISQKQTRAENSEMRDIAKYFVPASEILGFLPPEVRVKLGQ